MNPQRGNGRQMSDEERRMRGIHEQGMERPYHHADDRDRGRWGEDREREQYGASDHGFGQGQSGYMAGRYAEDPSLGRQGINQRYHDDDRRERTGFYGSTATRGGDERWLGRGGEDYARGYGHEPAGDPERRDWGSDRYGRGSGQGLYGTRGYTGGYRNERTTQSFRGLGPKNFQRSDERLKELVGEALTDDHDIDASEIEVEVKNGEVILKGTVEDRRAKRLAEDCVERIPGIRDVQNQIRIGNKWQASTQGNQNQGTQVGTSESEKSKHRA